MAAAGISFNYLGQLDQVLTEEGGFAGAPESAGANQSEQTAMNYALEINGSVSSGRLGLDWSFSPAVLGVAQVEKLLKMLKTREALFETNLSGLIA